MSMRWMPLLLCAWVFLAPRMTAAAEWSPKQAALMTRWSKEVSPEKVHPEYPRPQMVREKWVNLNGLWDYAIVATPASRPGGVGPGFDFSDKPDRWDGKILVPFPVESALSGVMQSVGPDKALWYKRSFEIPKSIAWNGKRVLLHFGAVDWETTVWVNGFKVGEHRGGYDPFSFDITDALFTRKSPTEEIVVRVWDGSDTGFQPRGKQVRNPHGIWYTPTTGIWQTVWLEPVPPLHIRAIQIDPDVDSRQVRLTVEVSDPNRVSAKITVKQGNEIVATALGMHSTPIAVSIPEPRLWSPDSPTLYTLEITIGYGNQPEGETITSYFAMRKISLGKDKHGVNRLMINHQPLFQYGTLDQGFWPDGLYTAPTDEALRFDIEMTKKLGFNMIRKHVKVEPARWYYHCDKLGMLVWQDMPSGDRHAAWDPFGKHDNTETTRSPESSENFNREWKSIIDALRNHPSIVMWVPFNEGWGQANTVAVTKWTKEYDPTRLVNCASGGNDFPVGDVIDVHRYPGPFAPVPTADRAAVLGEFGGLGLPLEGHTWLAKGNWGYRSFSSRKDLTAAYLGLLTRLRPLIQSPGLSAAIYTQTTDVEIEVNGLLTYDRAIVKMPAETIAAANRKLYLPLPKITTLVPTSEHTTQNWRFTTDKPAEGWQVCDFDDSAWKTGRGGFGEPSTPGSVVKTSWKTNDIWLRRTFELGNELPRAVHLRLHHDEDAEVYLNGVLAVKVTGYTTDYGLLAIRAEAQRVLRSGQNVLAVHCRQTGGGQYIDVGLVDVRELSP
jgi:hypothetical protein